MEYILWIIAIGAGFILGRASAPTEITPEEEKCDFIKAQLEKDIEYYKKLTRNLVEENKELRKNV